MLFLNIYFTLLILTLLSFSRFTLIWMLWEWLHYCWERHWGGFWLILIAASWDTLNLMWQSHTWIHLFLIYTSISGVLTGCGCVWWDVASYLCPLCCSAGGRSWLTGPQGRPWAPRPPRTHHWQGGCPCLGRHTPANTHHSPRHPSTCLIQEKQNYLRVVQEPVCGPIVSTFCTLWLNHAVGRLLPGIWAISWASSVSMRCKYSNGREMEM